MYVCIGICERREEKEARRDRLVGAGKDGTGRGGRCGGPAPGLSRPPYRLVLKFLVSFLCDKKLKVETTYSSVDCLMCAWFEFWKMMFCSLLDIFIV
ncbi:hypothetical protein HanPI659440_Chr03g0126331 [Helianthus annuus]|nr:hypothetical protein HanPI659440_Chr03g0126331 [Helianthus annuus]